MMVSSVVCRTVPSSSGYQSAVDDCTVDHPMVPCGTLFAGTHPPLLGFVTISA